MAKSPVADFEQDLEAVFEARAAEFSPELRQLLKQLWNEGIGRGRQLERHGALGTVSQVLNARSPASIQVHDAITTHAAMPVAGDITLDGIREALDSFPKSPAPDPGAQMFQKWADEVASQDSFAQEEAARKRFLGTWPDEPTYAMKSGNWDVSGKKL